MSRVFEIEPEATVWPRSLGQSLSPGLPRATLSPK